MRLNPFHHKTDRELLEKIATDNQEILTKMTANDTALANLNTAVAANTAATTAAVAALGTDGSDDVSAGIDAATSQVAANTAALTGATPAPSIDTTPATPVDTTPPATDAPATDAAGNTLGVNPDAPTA